MAGGLQELLQKKLGSADRPISAEQAAAGLSNPAYKVVSQKQMSQPYPDKILRDEFGSERAIEIVGKPVEFETNMAELDREWLADAIASGTPEGGDLSPAPAPRKSQPGPGDFTMAFDMNDYSPWLRKRRGSLMG